MNVLEKILEEIEEATFQEDAPIYAGDKEIDGYVRESVVKEIIRSHMDNAPNTNVGKWIPADDTEQTPKDESYVLVSFSNSNLPDIARYEENEEGGTYYPGGDEESYLKYGLFVNAWQPLPKPYKGE